VVYAQLLSRLNIILCYVPKPPVPGLQPGLCTVAITTQGVALGCVVSGFQPDLCLIPLFSRHALPFGLPQARRRPPQAESLSQQSPEQRSGIGGSHITGRLKACDRAEMENGF